MIKYIINYETFELYPKIYYDVINNNILELYNRPIKLCANNLDVFDVKIVDNLDSLIIEEPGFFKYWFNNFFTNINRKLLSNSRERLLQIAYTSLEKRYSEVLKEKDNLKKGYDDLMRDYNNERKNNLRKECDKPEDKKKE